MLGPLLTVVSAVHMFVTWIMGETLCLCYLGKNVIFVYKQQLFNSIRTQKPEPSWSLSAETTKCEESIAFWCPIYLKSWTTSWTCHVVWPADRALGVIARVIQAAICASLNTSCITGLRSLGIPCGCWSLRSYCSLQQIRSKTCSRWELFGVKNMV